MAIHDVSLGVCDMAIDMRDTIKLRIVELQDITEAPYTVSRRVRYLK